MEVVKLTGVKGMVDIQFLKYCLENPDDVGPLCVAELEQMYHETGDVWFLLEATRRKNAAAQRWYLLPKLLM